MNSARRAFIRSLHLNCSAVVATLDQPNIEAYVCDVLQPESESVPHQQNGTEVNKEISAILADEQSLESPNPNWGSV